MKHVTTIKILIFTGLSLICLRTLYSVGRGDGIWVIYLAVSFFFAYISYESYINCDNKFNKLYSIQALGFFALSIILFVDIFISLHQSLVLLACYAILYAAALTKAGGLHIIKNKIRKLYKE